MVSSKVRGARDPVYIQVTVYYVAAAYCGRSSQNFNIAELKLLN